MAQGLIAAAIGGFGKALSTIGEMEAKKQNEAKLRKEIMDMESEERLRLDEIMHERKLKRLPGEAVAQAEANVVGEVAGLQAASKTNLPALKATAAANAKKLGYEAETTAGVPKAAAIYKATTTSEELGARKNLGVVEAEAQEDVRKDVAKLVAENGSEKAKLLAQQKVNGRLAELAAIKDNKLDEAEARAKYDAFMTDLRIAKELGVDVAQAERDAEKENARISALIKNRVPENKAKLANEEKLETIRAQLNSSVITEEANLLAKQELAKIQAMTAQGVPEAKAKLLAAEWRAGKTQRDEAAAEQTQQKINSEIETARKLAGNKTYLADVAKIDIAKGAGERYNALYRENLRDNSDKKERNRNTIEMERQIKETNNEIGRIIGIGDPKKIPDELSFLESQANKGDAKAIEKLKKVKPLLNELDTLSRDLRSYKRGGTSSTAGESTSSSGKRPDISSFNK